MSDDENSSMSDDETSSMSDDENSSMSDDENSSMSRSQSVVAMSRCRDGAEISHSFCEKNVR